jgi:hypothetical protein
MTGSRGRFPGPRAAPDHPGHDALAPAGPLQVVNGIVGVAYAILFRGLQRALRQLID